MSVFNSRWSRKRFIVSIAISIAAFVALTVAFAYAVAAATEGTGCTVPGACGAVGLVFAMMVKPLVFGLFLLSLIPALAGRLRDIGVTPWLCLFVLLLIAADHAALLAAGAPWAFAFSIGVLQVDLPIYLFEALALIVVLGIVPPRDGRVSLRALGWPAWLALALALPVALAALFKQLPVLLSGLLPAIMALDWLLRPVFQFGIYTFWLLPVAVAFALWPRAGQTAAAAPTVPKGQRLPLMRLALIALGLAVVATLLVGPGGFSLTWLIMLPAATVPIVLPNAALFFAILLAAYLWAKRPSWIPAVLTVALVVIYGSWGYEQYLRANLNAFDARELAAIETYRPTVMPRAIVLESTTFLRELLERGDFDIVAVESKTGPVGYRYATAEEVPPDPHGGRAKIVPYDIAAMPDSYLVLKSWRNSSFYSDAHGGRYEGSSPYELRIAEDGSDRLVAVWYQRRMEKLSWLPVLTMMGWKRDDRQPPHLQDDDGIRYFLAMALGEPPAPQRL